MKEEQDLLEVPYNYPICLNDQCPKAATCLRQIVEQEVDDDVKFWIIISPKHQATFSGDCPYYRSNTKVRFAKGFMNILNSMPYDQRLKAVNMLIAHYSQRTYYRIRKGERLLNPAQQKEVMNIFRDCGVTGEKEFDAYLESFEW